MDEIEPPSRCRRPQDDVCELSDNVELHGRWSGAVHAGADVHLFVRQLGRTSTTDVSGVTYNATNQMLSVTYFGTFRKRGSTIRLGR